MYLFIGTSRMDGGLWSQASRLSYNLRDTISRSTVQVIMFVIPSDITLNVIFFISEFILESTFKIKLS